ncbi:MAG: FtsH protease activity modulator HflK [Holophagales bacterium]|nr:FtsH protease activity modulator HflK [Holophagales bacterium]MYC09241.1 FtsH protease activity modulator HflK [Holophagales bacterium]
MPARRPAHRQSPRSPMQPPRGVWRPAPAMGAHFHDDGHGHSHSHGLLQRIGYIALCVAVGVLLLLYLLGVVRTVAGIDLALILTLVAGYPLIRHAILDLLQGHFSSHLTIAIAAGAAVWIGEYFAAAEVMFIMLIGEGIEHWTVDRAKGAIAGFVASQPEQARVLRDGREELVALGEVEIGDTVRVLAGERVPVDGMIERGESSVDQSSVTGEPLPAQLGVGDAVWSGSLNEYGVLDIRSERTGNDTTVARIASLIEDAQSRRARVVRTADKLARFFLPAVLVAAGGIYLFTGEMMRTVAALIVACPCALVLATPAAMASAIARLAREGALVKGGDVIESLSRIDACVLDKTGTLTCGRPALTAIAPVGGVAEDRLLRLAASAELTSEHLLGRALVTEARERQLDLSEPENFRLHPGRGVTATVDGHEIAVGNQALLAEVVGEDGIDAMAGSLVPTPGSGETRLAVAVDGALAGALALADPLRDEATEAVADLRQTGVDPIVMLTGDAAGTARTIGRRAGIDQVQAELLPEDKVRRLGELSHGERNVLMVGDGINDAPSLAAASVGVAIGHGAADLSAEAAQVVLLPDRLDYLAPLLRYARRVVARIRSSILIFAFGINFVAVGFAAFGLLPPAAAAIVHQAASLLVILNCVRLLYEGRAVAAREERGLGRFRILAAPVGGLVAGWKGFNAGRRATVHRLEHALEESPARIRSAAPRLLRAAPFALAAVWAASGVRMIDPQEVGLVQRFGRHVGGELGPGLHLRWPWPVDRVTRVEPDRLRMAAVGSPRGATSTEAGAEPSYEWNVRHAGFDETPPLERLMLTGDENLVEVAARIHYRVADPAAFAFAAADPARLVETSAERSLRTVLAGHSLDDVLTGKRDGIEKTWHTHLAALLESLGAGVEVVSATVQDAHPPLDVVDAFRDAASALEERETLIDEAEGYALERLPIARGEARRQLLEAEAYRNRRVEAGRGESARFAMRAGAYRRANDLHRFRLQLQTIEGSLAGKPKLITDATGGRKRFVFVDETPDRLLDVFVPPPGSAQNEVNQ